MRALWRCTETAFIAAFTGGLGYGAAGGKRGERLVPYVEETGALVSLLVWLAFGAIAVVPAFESLTWQTVLYAVLSLTLTRMAPVALSLIGAGLEPRAVPPPGSAAGVLPSHGCSGRP